MMSFSGDGASELAGENYAVAVGSNILAAIPDGSVEIANFQDYNIGFDWPFRVASRRGCLHRLPNFGGVRPEPLLEFGWHSDEDMQMLLSEQRPDLDERNTQHCVVLVATGEFPAISPIRSSRLHCRKCLVTVCRLAVAPPDSGLR